MKIIASNLQVKTKYVNEHGCYLQADKYKLGGLALALHSNCGERLLTASVYIDGATCNLNDFEFYSKDWSENEGIVAWLKKAGIVDGTGCKVRTGFCESERLRLTDKYKRLLEA